MRQECDRRCRTVFCGIECISKRFAREWLGAPVRQDAAALYFADQNENPSKTLESERPQTLPHCVLPHRMGQEASRSSENRLGAKLAKNRQPEPFLSKGLTCKIWPLARGPGGPRAADAAALYFAV